MWRGGGGRGGVSSYLTGVDLALQEAGAKHPGSDGGAVDVGTGALRRGDEGDAGLLEHWRYLPWREEMIRRKRMMVLKMMVMMVLKMMVMVVMMKMMRQRGLLTFLLQVSPACHHHGGLSREVQILGGQTHWQT